MPETEFVVFMACFIALMIGVLGAIYIESKLDEKDEIDMPVANNYEDVTTPFMKMDPIVFEEHILGVLRESKNPLTIKQITDHALRQLMEAPVKPFADDVYSCNERTRQALDTLVHLRRVTVRTGAKGLRLYSPSARTAENEERVSQITSLLKGRRPVVIDDTDDPEILIKAPLSLVYSLLHKKGS